MMIMTTTVKQQLMQNVGFMKWVEVKREDVINILGHRNFDGQVFISPDVNSLHATWTLPSENLWQHQIADYPYDDETPLLEFLEDAILYDAYETEDLDRDIYEILSDYGTWTKANTPVMSLKQLGCEVE